jgi:thiosulfate dehydrogenase [quinone] large subunit
MNDTTSTAERTLVFLLRMAMAWIFLYAASHQVFDPSWSVTGFLSQTKTFHGFFSLFTGPDTAPITTFLVEYGHLLIGLSLLSGLLVRVSSIAGIGLMLLYWMAHMNLPYISSTTNLLVDEHVVYGLVLGLLIVKHAGHVWGLDAWVSENFVDAHHKLLGWATA